jgi:hypothetical protein
MFRTQNIPTNIGFVLRRGMEVDTRQLADGSVVLLLGKAQEVRLATGVLTDHAARISAMAEEMISTGRLAAVADMPMRKYLYVVQNRSLRTALANAGNPPGRFAGISTKRPDIIGVWIDDQGRIGVDMFEVASGDQSRSTLLPKLNEMMNTLPSSIIQGTRETFERTP